MASLKSYENHERSILLAWADELAKKVGRSPLVVREKGLLATDFPGASLELLFEDGSSMKFEGAFMLQDRDCRTIAVFTEHCGYYLLPSASVDGISIEVHARE